MTIKVYSDRIEIGAKVISTTPTGIRIDDSLAANTQAQGYVRQANFTARELALGNFAFQGTVAGYTSGGNNGPTNSNVIDKFPFSSDNNASDVGDMTSSRNGVAGQSSDNHGYVSGGYGPTYSNIIEKFPFSVDTNATDVGDLTQARSLLAGHSSSTYGFSSGGEPPSSGVNTIDKFPFATDVNASDHGDVHRIRYGGSSHSSSTHGYSTGGRYDTPGQQNFNVISKFPFANNTGSNDVGDLNFYITYAAGQSSTVSGYVSGGQTPPQPPPGLVLNTILKFPFATDSNSSDVGDITVARRLVAGQSSDSNGYSSGGIDPTSTVVNTIDKFPFAADTNATDVGDISASRLNVAGQQY